MTETYSRKAVIYSRVSSIKQTVDGTGLQSQEIRCHEYAKVRGLDVIKTFTDDVSGAAAKRPGFTSLLKFLKARRQEGTVVIIDDISRIARDVRLHLDLKEALEKSGAELERFHLSRNRIGDSGTGRQCDS